MGTNYYFHRSPETCPECGRGDGDEGLHIGKSSAGWVFLWRGHRDHNPPLLRPSDWAEFISSTPGVIKDEYGVELSLGDLLTKAALKRRGGHRASDEAVNGDFAESCEGDELSFGEFC